MLTVSQTMANLLIMGKRHGKRVTLQTDKHRFLEMPRPKGRHLKTMVQNIFVVIYNLFSVSKVGICHARKYHFLFQLCF